MKKMMWFLIVCFISGSVFGRDLKEMWDDDKQKNVYNFYRMVSTPRVSRVVTTNVVVSDIPSAVMAVSSKYAATLQKYFGLGAETNEVITQSVVAFYFQSLPDDVVTVDVLRDAVSVENGFKILTGFIGSDVAWDYPFGSTQLTNEVISVNKTSTTLMGQHGYNWKNYREMCADLEIEY